jgi:diguanylate cyclase (GGDEF)-like protein
MSQPVVLVAEDSLVIRAVVVSQLEDQGYRVLPCADGAEALSTASAALPDVMLLDVEMPMLDGYQVLEAMKRDSALADIPVVFLTGRAETDDVVKGLRLGAHDYLRKPFDAAELMARVSSALRIKQLRDALRERNEELERISRTDPLTSLPNRRHLEQHLEAAASAARRHDHHVAVLLVDVDRFKGVNDAYGHAHGDQVLFEVARRLLVAMRAEDLVGRWGGEEFLAVLPHTDGAGARVVAERLRAEVASSPVLLADGRAVPVTVSVGCSTGTTGADVLRAADEALYAAKDRGRNRVEVASV